MQSTMMLALAALLMLSSVNAISSPQYTLMDSSGSLRLNQISSGASTSDGVVSVITSPGTDSFLVSGDVEDACVLAFDGEETSLICRGATLRGTSASERSALAITSLVSDAIVIDGITEGDVQAAGFGKNTRHARTLTALFRARLSSSADASGQQALVLCVKSASEDSFDDVLAQEVRALFEATAAEATESNTSFDDLYDVTVVSVTNKEEASEVSSNWRWKIYPNSTFPFSTRLVFDTNVLLYSQTMLQPFDNL